MRAVGDQADAARRLASSLTLTRSSSGPRIVNGQLSPVSTRAAQSNELTRMRRSVSSPWSISSARVGGSCCAACSNGSARTHLDLEPPGRARERAADVGDDVESSGGAAPGLR